MRLENEPLDGFLLSEDRAVIVHYAYREEGRAEVYDRSTWLRMASVPFSEYPMDVLLEAGVLCIGNPCGGSGVQMIDQATGGSVRHALN